MLETIFDKKLRSLDLKRLENQRIYAGENEWGRSIITKHPYSENFDENKGSKNKQNLLQKPDLCSTKLNLNSNQFYNIYSTTVCEFSLPQRAKLALLTKEVTVATKGIETSGKVRNCLTKSRDVMLGCYNAKRPSHTTNMLTFQRNQCILQSF